MSISNDFTGFRNCLVHCHKCAKDHPNNKEAYRYWSKIHSADVKIRKSPLTNRPSLYTGCSHCGEFGARIMQIEKKEKKKNIIDEAVLKEKREKNLEKYARKYGEKAAKTDFIQPEQREEFKEAFGHDGDKMKKAYTESELESMGRKKLVEEKQMDKQINRLNREGRTTEAADLEEERDKLKQDN